MDKLSNEQKISLLKEYINIFGKESNLAIYLHLGIQGQMTPHDIIENTIFGKATVFRALKELIDSKLIDTDIDPAIEDKRKNKVYFVIKDLDDFPTIDEDFITFCIENGHTDTLEDFIVFIRSLAVNSMKVSMDFRDHITIKDSKQDWYSKLARRGMFSFLIVDYEDQKVIRDYAIEFLEKIDKLQNKDRNLSRKPIENPIILSLGIFPLRSKPPIHD